MWAYRDLEMRLTFQETMEWRVYRSFLIRVFPKEKRRPSLIKTDEDDRVGTFEDYLRILQAVYDDQRSTFIRITKGCFELILDTC